MAAASLDVNFKEELGAIEQCMLFAYYAFFLILTIRLGFRVLSEAERTAALYSLLQHSTQVQIRFFITVLQQMARSDPMTALLSPGMGGSMQAQMEAKLASMGLKSPALKAPSSPSSRNFSGSGANFLTPDSAALASPSPDAAATLAQQRARLKANNTDAATRRISAPGTLSNTGDGRNVWQPPQLGQVAERAPSPVVEQSPPSPGPTAGPRPKSTDFTGVANSFKSRAAVVVTNDATGEEVLSPMAGGNWASMVNTPLVPMFSENKPNLSDANGKLSTWTKSNSNNGRIALADAKAFRRPSKASTTGGDSGANSSVYGDDGNLLVPGSSRGGSSTRNGGSSGGFGAQNWGARSPSLSGASSNRYGNQDELAAAAAAAGLPFGMGLAGSPQMALGMNPLMGGLGGFNMNMMNLGMAMDPLQAQYLAAQIAAGQFAAGQFANLQNPQMMAGMRGGRGPSNSRMPMSGGKSSQNGRETSANKEKEDEVDPALLNDVPAWLRSLRLHKYTPNFEGMGWKEMVVMDEAALEAKGVAALGARRKMLKTFEAVRAKMNITMPGEENIGA